MAKRHIFRGLALVLNKTDPWNKVIHFAHTAAETQYKGRYGQEDSVPQNPNGHLITGVVTKYAANSLFPTRGT